MTIEEAKKILEGELLVVTLESNVSKKEIQEKRLNEKFRALNIAIEAIDKQIPKKVINLNTCPICGVPYVLSMPYYCECCGQALDRSDSDD